MSPSVTKNIESVRESIINMMNVDEFEYARRESVMNIVNIVLKSDEYVDIIKIQIKKINEDGKFDAKDLPPILIIIAESKIYLSSIIKDAVELKSTLKLDSMKYITFGVILFVMLTEKVDKTIIDETISYYSPLWDLIAFDPKDLLIKADTFWRKTFPQCFECSCCAKQTLAERWKNDVINATTQTQSLPHNNPSQITEMSF